MPGGTKSVSQLRDKFNQMSSRSTMYNDCSNRGRLGECLYNNIEGGSKEI